MTRCKVALGKLFDIGSSKRVLQSQWENEGVPFYRGREITKLAAEGFVNNELFISENHYAELAERNGVPKCGDIMITAIGTIGNSYVVKDGDRFYFKDASVLWLKKVSEASSAFINLWLKSPQFFDQLDTGNGATVDTLTIQKLKSVQVPDIPLPEQQRIVTILDEAFDSIATAKANAVKNLKNARALFESHLQSVFTQRDEGWLEKKFGDVCGFVRGPFGGSLKKSIFVADGYAIYEQQHAIYDQFDDIRYFINEAKFQEMKRFVLLPNDLIMSCSGTMGRVAIVPDGIRRGIINQALLKLTPSSKISNTFLKYWMESEAFQDALKEYSGGAAIQNVASVKILKEIKVPLPSVEEQERVVDKLESISAETQRLESIYQQKLAALDALKKSLLDQAFTGAL